MLDNPRIGSLRWRVTLARRSHATDPLDLTDPALAVVYADRVQVSADISPVGTQAFLLGQQLEIGAVTHRITIRWRPIVTMWDVVLRETLLPDGSVRQDIYRIHRMAEMNGRARFLILDAELEARSA